MISVIICNMNKHGICKYNDALCIIISLSRDVASYLSRQFIKTRGFRSSKSTTNVQLHPIYCLQNKNIHKHLSLSISQLQCAIDRSFKCQQCIIEDMTNLENFHLKEKWVIIDWPRSKVTVGFKKLVSALIKIEAVSTNWI